MKKFLQHWLTPPRIDGDKEKVSQARFLFLFIWASWIVMVIVIITALFFKDWKSIAVLAACFALLGVPYVLLRRGHVDASSLAVAVMMIVSITLVSTIGQGLRDMSLIAYPIVFIFAGLTMKRAHYRLCFGLTLLAVSWLAFGEDFGWFTTQPLNYPNWLYLITVVIILLVSALAVELLAATMRRNLELARQEIAERRLAEDTLRESEAYLKFSQQAAHLGHWVWDAQTNQISRSDEMLRIFGLEPGQDGLNPGDLFITAVHPDDREKCKHYHQAILRDGKADPVDFRIVLPDGTVRILCSEVGYREVDADGKMIRLMGIMQDITERKQTEAIALASQKLAGIGRLAAGMAHEINSPLQVMTGISDRLARQLSADEFNKEQFQSDIDTISRNSWRIAKIVRSLLTYARRSAPVMTPEQLNDIIGSALALSEHELKNGLNIVIESQLAPDLPPVYCDSSRITQVIINLLENARQAMPEGGWIRISTARSPDNGRVVLRVSDTGDGIPAEQQSRIFDPFFTTRDVGQGTGLGLSIVQGIVEAHGGEIAVESAPGKGAVFTITFPEEPPPEVEGLSDERFG